MRDVAEGPQTLLGIDRALAQREKDPLLEGRRILVADDTAKVRKITLIKWVTPSCKPANT